MKKLILTTILSVFAMLAFAAGEAEIKFEKTSHNFGSFPESQKVTCTFKFTNTGDNLLVIHQARRKWRNHGHLQWCRKISRSLQEIDNHPHQCQARNRPLVCGRRHAGRKIKKHFGVLTQICRHLIRNVGIFYVRPAWTCSNG